MRKEGISQAELARRLNVTPGAVSNWISERNPPSMSRLQEILGVLGVKPAYFWGAVVPEPPAGDTDPDQGDAASAG